MSRRRRPPQPPTLTVVELLRRYLVAIVGIGSLVASAAVYGLNYFATKEQMNYFFCLNDRQILIVDAKIQKASIDDGLARLYQQQAQFDARFKRAIPINQLVESRKLADSIAEHRTAAAEQTAILKRELERTCK